MRLSEMTDFDKKLANRLLYLSLDLDSKVCLWLTYRDIKPVSAILIKDKNELQFRKIIKWFEDAGLYHSIESDCRNCFHVSRHKEKAELSSRVLHLFDYDNEYLSGTLFGFPKDAAKAYAENRDKKSQVDKTLMLSGNEKDVHPYLSDKYYAPYILYAVRSNHIEDDSQSAKLWADTIRKEVPVLAEKFERINQKQVHRFAKLKKNVVNLNKPIAQLLMDYLGEELLLEKSLSVEKIKEIFLKIMSDFFDGNLPTWKLSGITTNLIKRMPNNSGDEDFREIVFSAASIYELEGIAEKTDELVEKLKQLLDWYKDNKKI